MSRATVKRPAKRPAARRDSFGGKPPRPRWLIAVLSAAATLGVVAAIGLIWAAATFGGPGPKARQGEQTVAVLERGTLAGSRAIRTLLADLGPMVAREDVLSPAIIVVGEVVTLSDATEKLARWAHMAEFAA